MDYTRYHFNKAFVIADAAYARDEIRLDERNSIIKKLLE